MFPKELEELEQEEEGKVVEGDQETKSSQVPSQTFISRGHVF